MSNETKLPTIPDWVDAPEWAMWRCVDSYGDLEYHEHKPEIYKGFWCSPYPLNHREMVAGRGYDATNWKNSLQKRPE